MTKYHDIDIIVYNDVKLVTRKSDKTNLCQILIEIKEVRLLYVTSLLSRHKKWNHRGLLKTRGFLNHPEGMP